MQKANKYLVLMLLTLLALVYIIFFKDRHINQLQTHKNDSQDISNNLVEVNKEQKQTVNQTTPSVKDDSTKASVEVLESDKSDLVKANRDQLLAELLKKNKISQNDLMNISDSDLIAWIELYVRNNMGLKTNELNLLQQIGQMLFTRHPDDLKMVKLSLLAQSKNYNTKDMLPGGHLYPLVYRGYQLDPNDETFRTEYLSALAQNKNSFNELSNLYHQNSNISIYAFFMSYYCWTFKTKEESLFYLRKAVDLDQGRSYFNDILQKINNHPESKAGDNEYFFFRIKY